MGVAAIGSGAWTAMGALVGHRLASLSENEVIYRLCEAKFLAESAIGVGRNSYVAILRPDGDEGIIMTNQLEELRKIWESEGRPKIPPSALEIIEKEKQEARDR